ncbi:MurR/RpiR family transcriptional regulator [Enemella evansiae]|uniref:MurR/RpiR family transcriptional regulator n=1 Tax=Enemella evansiae TaxID=2016499 RepID=UPI00105CD317|nr:MurR/RpiR family transcriptional regulator [Enemella evansiae]TDO94592.1 RpiR family transcriptional regulator [Enemella evansiae]
MTNAGGDSMQDWLRSRLPAEGLSERAARVFHHLALRPGEAAHVPASEVATATGTSLSTVTRLAQRLGFRGWPELQRELRSRYLAGLSLAEVTASHRSDEAEPWSSLRHDLTLLDETLRSWDPEAVQRAAGLIDEARQVHVTAHGSYAAVGLALKHNLGLAGFPVGELLGEPSAVANAVSRMGPGDLLVVCSYWRLYNHAVIAAQQAHRAGAQVVLIADHLAPALADTVDEVLLVSSESSSFFPSMTGAIAVAQALVATAAELDPQRTMTALARAEQGWETFGLMHHSVPRDQARRQLSSAHQHSGDQQFPDPR